MIRTFIAVELPERVRTALAGSIEEVARRWDEGRVRWVGAENMHLTLRFLGDTDPDLVPALSAGLDRVVGGEKLFELGLGEMGCFPNPRRPRVIWVGLWDEGERLLGLQQEVERLACDHGWEREKRSFRPHLTLGRVRDRTRPPDGEWLRDPEEFSFQVEKVLLIQSELRRSGAVYTALHTALLGGG
ncbi:MAG: RNA 2',3'-cyclic phosphodiesterase [Gemmatimonadetes bacterium]|jgi:RNA 2',3'-cyclic 3'-phosphodiesterase|nr:RNA 2',3'-cyclic phosphodiesterase [Gemmatimonadota bacterium]